MMDIEEDLVDPNTSFDAIKSERDITVHHEQFYDYVDFSKQKENKESFQVDFDIDYEVDQEFKYAIYIKLIQSQNEKQLEQDMIVYIVAYEQFFDISLREFAIKKNQRQLIVYRGFDNQNVDYRVKKKRTSCKFPKEFDESKIIAIRDTLKKQLPHDSRKKNDYFTTDLIQDIPVYFPSKLYALNAFFYSGTNSENYYTCELAYDKLKNLTESQQEDDIEFQQKHQEEYVLEVVSKVVSASIDYSLDRDHYMESLNKDNRPCYNFKVEYIEESQANRSFLDSYPLGCLDKDIEIQFKDLYYENYKSIGTRWYQFMGKKTQSKTKSIIIHKNTNGFRFKHKNLFMPHFATSGRFFPIMIHNRNQFIFNLYFSTQNLFQIHQTDQQSFVEETVSLKQLSLRDYASIDDKRVVCQRSFYEDDQVITEKDFKIEDREKVNILILDEIYEQLDTEKRLPDQQYVMTYSKSMKNQGFYGPMSYSNNVQFVCWQKIDADSADYIILPQAISIPFKHPLVILKLIDDQLKFQLYKNYTSLDLECSIPKSQLDNQNDFDVFDHNVSVNYVSIEQDYLSWAFQHIQRQDINKKDLQESLIFIIKEVNIGLIPNVSECEILSKDDEILINIYLEGIQKEKEDELQNERKLLKNTVVSKQISNITSDDKKLNTII